MRCPTCGEEVLLAERCPYCGSRTGAQERARQGAAGPRGGPSAGAAGTDGGSGRPAGPRGRFVGPMERPGRDGRADADGASGYGGFGHGPFGQGAFRVWWWGARPDRAEPVTGGRLSPLEWLRRLVAFLRDSRVPAWKKGLFAAALLYLLMPFDLAPDLFPILGWADDVAVLWFGLRALSRELSRYVPPVTAESRGLDDEEPGSRTGGYGPS